MVDATAEPLGAERARSPGCAGHHTHVRRQPEQSVLHQVVREHLETFLAEVRQRGGGEGLPRFVERELREFLTCGVMARGFARFRCDGCRREILVAFSCKGRGFCPSCCGRRMGERAAHLVDGVLGSLPVRQWVLTLPFRLRYRLAYDHRLCRAVLGVFVPQGRVAIRLLGCSYVSWRWCQPSYWVGMHLTEGGSPMAQSDPPATLRDNLRTAWHRYIDLIAPLRPALHGYCRRLTGDLWDAEDLVQDTLLRVFGQWGVTYPEIREPRAYLLRAATNIWIDRLRRKKEWHEMAADDVLATAPAADPELSTHVRDAGTMLLQNLAPQERAALMLKEAFDMPLEEIATLLATSPGAVKSALHRGRERLRDPAAASAARPLPSAQLVDRFIDRFSARDIPGLIALMLDGAVAENVGNSLHVGDGPEEGLPHFFFKVIHGHEEWPPEAQWDSARMQRGEVAGEPVALYFVTRGAIEALTAIMRIDEQEGRIARIRSYGFCPEVVRAVGKELGVRVLTGLYRAP